jgi:uridine phosphorylase
VPYPNVPGKYAAPSVTGPGDFLDAARTAGWDPGPLPAGVVFNFSPLVTQFLEGDARFIENRGLAPSNARFFTDGVVGISCLSPGGPAMATQAQNLVHLGVRRFVVVGTAGSIREDVGPGRTILVTGAVRDDGVSHHFLAPARYVEPSGELTARLGGAARALGLDPLEAPSWTQAVAFRMTAGEISEYAAEGVVAVEMEAAALFGVAEALGADGAAAVVVTDVTTPGGRIAEDWDAASEPLLALLESALLALRP